MIALRNKGFILSTRCSWRCILLITANTLRYTRTHIYTHCFIVGIKVYLLMFATLREMFVKKLSKKGYLEPSFPNLTASHVSKDSLSRRIFPLGKKNKESKTIYTSYEKHKGINAYWYNITQNIYVLMFEVSWTSLKGKSCEEQQQRRTGKHAWNIYSYSQ